MRGVSGRLQPRSTLLGVVIALIVSALAGAAIWLQIQGWSSLGTDSGGACGTRYGACPPGSTPVLVGSFLVAFVAIPAALFTWYWRPRRLFLLLLVVGLVGGGFAGQAAFTGLHGVSLSVRWSTPFDGPNNLATQGVWVQGGSVVRVRIDEVVSYADATGAAQWTYPIPGQDAVCAVSRTTAGSVGVLAYGAQNAPCGHLVAIDLTGGRQLWATDVPTDGQEAPPIDDFVAAAGNLVVTRVGDQVVAFDARTGAQRWARSSSSGCQVEFVAADPSAVVGIAACQNGYLVSDLDPATGTPKWETPVVEPSYQLALLSVAPVVVSDLVPGARSVDNVRVFTAQGKQDVTIPVSSVSSPDGPVGLAIAPRSGKGFGPQPLWWAVVADGMLVGVTPEVNGHDDAIAFSLATGRQQWLTALSTNVDAVARNGNGLMVLDDTQPAMVMQSISLANGSVSQLGVINSRDFDLNDDVALYPVAGRYVAVNQVGVNPDPPVFAFGG